MSAGTDVVNAANRQRFLETQFIRIDERTPRSAANGNARFAVAWMRGIASTSGPYEQDPHFQRMMQRLGNTEAMCSRHYNQQASRR